SGPLGDEPADAAPTLVERDGRRVADLLDRDRGQSGVPVVERGRRAGREETPPAPGAPGDRVGRERGRAQELAAYPRELVFRDRLARAARELLVEHRLDAIRGVCGPGAGFGD